MNTGRGLPPPRPFVKASSGVGFPQPHNAAPHPPLECCANMSLVPFGNLSLEPCCKPVRQGYSHCNIPLFSRNIFHVAIIAKVPTITTPRFSRNISHVATQRALAPPRRAADPGLVASLATTLPSPENCSCTDLEAPHTGDPLATVSLISP